MTFRRCDADGCMQSAGHDAFHCDEQGYEWPLSPVEVNDHG